MEDFAVKSIDDIPGVLRAIRAGVDAVNKKGDSAPLLFRGQTDARWKLQTTLERYTDSPFKVAEYFRVIATIRGKLAAFSGIDWPFNYGEALKWSEAMPFGLIPGYDYMVYLRHHGFPSPLLDWSASSQIALFFAFREFKRDAERVALYIFWDDAGQGKVGSSDRPSITTYGPVAGSHARHFLQQSQYSICSLFQKGSQHVFAPHEQAIQISEEKKLPQDLLWRITIPVTERNKVLARFAEYNLNAFSLFNSTESLAEALAEEHLRR